MPQVLSCGADQPPLTSAEAMGYVLSLPGVSTVIIGCSSPAEVDENAHNARTFRPFDELAMRSPRRTHPLPRRLFHFVQEAGLK